MTKPPTGVGTSEHLTPDYSKLIRPAFSLKTYHPFLYLYRHAEGDGEIPGSVAGGEAEEYGAFDRTEGIQDHLAQKAIVRIAPGHLAEDDPFHPGQLPRAL